MTTKSAPGRKPKLGSGKRFANLERKFEARGMPRAEAAAMAAAIGRKKYGNKKFSKLAAKGRK